MGHGDDETATFFVFFLKEIYLFEMQNYGTNSQMVPVVVAGLPEVRSHLLSGLPYGDSTEPILTTFPGSLTGSWLASGTIGTLISVLIGCGNHTQQLYWLYHSAGLQNLQNW